MNAHAPPSTGWFRRLLIMFGIAGLLALAFSYFDGPARREPLQPDMGPIPGLKR